MIIISVNLDNNMHFSNARYSAKFSIFIYFFERRDEIQLRCQFKCCADDRFNLCICRFMMNSQEIYNNYVSNQKHFLGTKARPLDSPRDHISELLIKCLTLVQKVALLLLCRI